MTAITPRVAARARRYDRRRVILRDSFDRSKATIGVLRWWVIDNESRVYTARRYIVASGKCCSDTVIIKGKRRLGSEDVGREAEG